MIVAVLIVVVGVYKVFLVLNASSKPTLTKVLVPSPTPLPPPSPTLQPSPTKTLTLPKSSYIIALYGDSYIDTMVDTPVNIKTILQKKYPTTTFTIYNYGIGAENIEAGLNRWDSSFSNRGRDYPPITQINADIIVIGAFSYNPFSPHDAAKHKELLKELVSKAKQTSAKVYILAEIAPLGPQFGVGPKGVNWTPDVAIEHSHHIIDQIQNAFAVGNELGVPVMDAYNPSKNPGSEFGDPGYVNRDDGIHPSVAGHALIANVMVSTISFK